MNQRQYTVMYGSIAIDFTLEYSDRKTVAIAVHPDCRVVVTAPKRADFDKVQQLVHKRARWIQKQKQYFQQFLPRTPSKRFVGGESHLYLGRRYRLKLVYGENPSIKLLRGYLVIHHPNILSSEVIEKELYNWYKIRAEHKLRERFELCLASFTEKNAIQVPELHIRRMKSRWGSYAPSGRLTLNLELIKAPIDCIDYVIVHEFCHAVHANHSKQFYKLLELVMPDYRMKKNKLELGLS